MRKLTYHTKTKEVYESCQSHATQIANKGHVFDECVRGVVTDDGKLYIRVASLDKHENFNRQYDACIAWGFEPEQAHFDATQDIIRRATSQYVI